MNHSMDFDPIVIRERNQHLHREVRSLRLEERVREERGSSGSRFAALAQKGREAPAARGTPRGVAMVGKRAGV
jgi:hypothetical protein